MSNILETLKHEHKELKSIMTQLSRLQHQGDKQLYDEYFSKFKTEFRDYGEVEQKILYPEIKDHPQVADLVNKGAAAHHMAKIGIIELRLVPFQSDSWSAKFAVVRDAILSHIQEEEKVLFPKINRILNQESLQELDHQAMNLHNQSMPIEIGIV